MPPFFLQGTYMSKTKPFILVCDGMDANLFSSLKSDDRFQVHPQAKNTQEEIKAQLPHAHALVIRSATKVNQELIDQAPHLKYVIRAGEGTDNIDKVYCAEKGIKVSNTPGANNNSAAEHSLALMMTLLRKTATANQSMQSGKWDKSQFTGNELWKKKIGIIGLGRIGQLLAKRLSGFEPEVLFFDPLIYQSPFDFAKKVENIDQIFSECDIVSIHVPLIESTKNLINARTLSLMKPHAILVNAARGGIVNEEDLIQALNEGKIAGAALDVFSTEPLPNQSPLIGVPNLILTPHLGGSTQEAQFRVGELACRQLTEFFVNNKLLNEVKAK